MRFLGSHQLTKQQCMWAGGLTHYLDFTVKMNLAECNVVKSIALAANCTQGMT